MTSTGTIFHRGRRRLLPNAAERGPADHDHHYCWHPPRVFPPIIPIVDLLPTRQSLAIGRRN